MADRFQFKAMRTATNDLPEGSPEWIEGMSVRLQYTFDKVENFGIEPLIECLRPLVKTEPWNHIPKDKPCKRADVYFQGVTGKPWKVLLAMVQEYDSALAADIMACVNPGKGNYQSGSDNITTRTEEGESPKRGTSRAYNLNRLKREAPELFEEVKAGNMTANAAAIKAGFRKKPGPHEIAVKQLSKMERLELIDLQARITALLQES